MPSASRNGSRTTASASSGRRTNWVAGRRESDDVRLLIHVEGETEEAFVNQVLAPYLAHHDFTSISARLLGNARQRNRRGGARSWKGVRKEILRHLRSDRECISATLVDCPQLALASM